jgi:EAL domain-containing protein (putative c-di-GMP-specific phosphodiesterase class I)
MVRSPASRPWCAGITRATAWCRPRHLFRAEESGIIVALGEWILRTACREAAAWPRPLHLAINLSPVQFQHGDLVRMVYEILLETGLSPSRLELEITEGVLIGDFRRAVAILQSRRPDRHG